MKHVHKLGALAFWGAAALTLTGISMAGDCPAVPEKSAAVPQPAAVAAHTLRAARPAPELPEPEEEEPENERIEAALLARAHVIEGCTVTHYDPCEACCGRTGSLTASGIRPTPYVSVAVDPAVIPLGADVLADYGDGEIHYYRADDTGYGVTGNHIDLCVPSHEEAQALGVRTAAVYWIEIT